MFYNQILHLYNVQQYSYVTYTAHGKAKQRKEIWGCFHESLTNIHHKSTPPDDCLIGTLCYACRHYAMHVSSRVNQIRQINLAPTRFVPSERRVILSQETLLIKQRAARHVHLSYHVSDLPPLPFVSVVGHCP